MRSVNPKNHYTHLYKWLELKLPFSTFVPNKSSCSASYAKNKGKFYHFHPLITWYTVSKNRMIDSWQKMNFWEISWMYSPDHMTYMLL